MQRSDTVKSRSVVFDDPGVVASAELVRVMELAARAGLAELVDQQLSVSGDKGANSGLKVCSPG
jgi:hypothetical protein